MGKPTILTVQDIDRFVESIINHEIRVVKCCTCDNESMETGMVDGIQCEECFYKRIPMFGSCPVSPVFFGL